MVIIKYNNGYQRQTEHSLALFKIWAQMTDAKEWGNDPTPEFYLQLKSFIVFQNRE